MAGSAGGRCHWLGPADRSNGASSRISYNSRDYTRRIPVLTHTKCASVKYPRSKSGARQSLTGSDTMGLQQLQSVQVNALIGAIADSLDAPSRFLLLSARSGTRSTQYSSPCP